MNSRLRRNLIAAPYSIWMIGFIIIPLIFVVFYGLTNDNFNFTLANIASITDPVHLKSFWKAFYLAFISTIVCILLAYPIALIFRNSKTNKSSLIVYLFILPMWMNGLLRIYAWLTLIERKGVINLILSAIGLPNINIVNTEIAIVLGMVYDFLPFMILPLYNSLSKIKEDTLNGARDLGANELQVFIKIIFPLSIPGMVSGITMVFIPALTTVAISYMLGGGLYLLIGNVIEQEFLTTANWHLGSGISLVLIIFIFIVMGITNKFTDKDEEISMV
ncbi:MAG: ABC transporter permease [Lachnospiraceae bacterium]|nr:ABC transporter permease [Lachnospiraceae bacterium]